MIFGGILRYANFTITLVILCIFSNYIGKEYDHKLKCSFCYLFIFYFHLFSFMFYSVYIFMVIFHSYCIFPRTYIPLYREIYRSFVVFHFVKFQIKYYVSFGTLKCKTTIKQGRFRSLFLEIMLCLIIHL